MPIETAWWHWAWNLYALDGGHSVISSSDLGFLEVTPGDRLYLDRVSNGCTLAELETTLPYFPDEDESAYLLDLSMDGYYRRLDEFPYDYWDPYGGSGMSADDRRVTTAIVLSEYYELRDYIRANCRGVYARFHHHLVELRNADTYPFRPVFLFPDPSNENWYFQEEEESVVPTSSRDGNLQ